MINTFSAHTSLSCHARPHTSRGLGDRDFKMASLLTCEPELSCITLLPGQDAFSIFATDGLWCVVDDVHAVAEVHAVLRQVSAIGAEDSRFASLAGEDVGAFVHALRGKVVRCGRCDAMPRHGEGPHGAEQGERWAAAEGRFAQ